MQTLQILNKFFEFLFVYIFPSLGIILYPIFALLQNDFRLFHYHIFEFSEIIRYNSNFDFIHKICNLHQYYRKVLSSIKSICEMNIPFICHGK